MCWIDPTSPGLEIHPVLKSMARIPGSPWQYLQPRHHKTGRTCAVLRCRRPADRARRSRLCHRCMKRRWRLNNPAAAVYGLLRSGAARRGIPFDLTYDQFLAFARETGYLDSRGTFTGRMHLDRKNPLLGYTPGNLRVLEAGANSHKGATFDKAAWAAARRGHYEPDPF